MIKDSLNKKPLVNSPTLLDDATATRLGLKEYFHGTTYNGGNAPTVTKNAGLGTLDSVSMAVFIPYQMQNGLWRLKFNLSLVVSATTRTYMTFNINGITSINVIQFISGYATGTVVTPNTCNMPGSSNTFEIGHSSTANTGYIIGGDIKLASKPTWAY